MLNIRPSDLPPRGVERSGIFRPIETPELSHPGKNTHVEAKSSLAIRHHQNWRVKSLELLEHATADDLAFTAPVSIARKDIPKVRAILLDAISDIAKIVENSPAGEVGYLGIDWMKM
jgi:hypothetical protein